ncbi:neurotrophin 1 isoform X2 [Musca domestica]|uniref:Neurotrophin 1 isoform X2 n=1 Tax=Musca domestica TaxID=7370 RepID=A0ABM3VCJ3_MUSDO|nr:neurotrophin 1 isoform X2 [Musca domestica]
MKMGQSFRCLFWAILYCVLYLVSASDEDLMDFDFGDLKEIDWSYENNNDHDILNKATTAAKENSITFDDDIDFLEEDDDQMQRYDWREKMLRTALSKALTNKVVRQKFIEVMPILRVLSKQQKLALSALITAQFSAKKGNELRLDQVRMMFGDDKSLILPVVYDIANLVKNSAKKYIEFDYSIQDLANFGKTKSSADRRKLELTSTELAEEENNEGIGTLPYTAADASKEEEQGDDMEDFMEDMPEEFLDPMEINKELLVVKEESSKNNNTEILKQTEDTEKEKSKEKKTDIPIEDAAAEVIVDHPLKINHELQKDVPTLELIKGNIPTLNTEEDISKVPTTKSTTTPIPLRRTRRATENRAFVHKLIRSVPASVNEADLQRGLGGRTLKLNTTAFATPKETTLTPLTTTTPVEVEQKPSNEANPDLEPYQIVEDLAFASLNGTEIVLNDEDEPQEREVSSENSNPDGELLPTPEELIAGPRYRVAANKLIRPAKGKRVPPKQIRTRPQQGSGVTPPKKCERFTASMCIRTEDYPMDLIMGSIRRHRNAMTALLAEYTDRQYSAEFGDDFEDFNQGKKRRQDTNEVHSGLCQSIVRYARPQKARSASGEWKFIVNTGKHTQTLRLEKCTNPQETCSYLSSSYKSYCSQVYNYHRLLSWDKTRGLHVDIFKVPTCCSCQINGIRQQQFAAAVGGTFTKKDFTPIPQKPQEVYRPDSFDYTEDDEEEDEDDLAFNIRNYHHYKHDTSFDANELLSGGSNKVKTKVPSPTVGSYLSPPDNDEFGQYPYKLTRDSSNIFKPSAPGPSPSLSSSASSSVSASSSNKILRELARRRPHKSFSNDYQSDLEFSPSEHHAEREAVATTILRPSPPAPEPFVPSHPKHYTMSQLQDDHALLPMPTKSPQPSRISASPPQTPYQQRLPVMEQHYSNHQYPSQHQHQPSVQHHYQPITTPMLQADGPSPSQGYGSRERKRPPPPPQHRLRSPKRPNTLRRHRSARLYRL